MVQLNFTSAISNSAIVHHHFLWGSRIPAIDTILTAQFRYLGKNSEDESPQRRPSRTSRASFSFVAVVTPLRFSRFRSDPHDILLALASTGLVSPDLSWYYLSCIRDLTPAVRRIDGGNRALRTSPSSIARRRLTHFLTRVIVLPAAIFMSR